MGESQQELLKWILTSNQSIPYPSLESKTVPKTIEQKYMRETFLQEHRTILTKAVCNPVLLRIWCCPQPWFSFPSQSPLFLVIFFKLIKQSEGKSWLSKWAGERILQGIATDNKDRSILWAIQSVKEANHLVPATLEVWIIHLVEELVKSGQHKNLMSPHILRWESTTSAGTQTGILKESGATLLIQISDGSTALSQSVHHQC